MGRPCEEGRNDELDECDEKSWRTMMSGLVLGIFQNFFPISSSMCIALTYHFQAPPFRKTISTNRIKPPVKDSLHDCLQSKDLNCIRISSLTFQQPLLHSRIRTLEQHPPKINPDMTAKLI